jgi:hypothetical protein
MAMPLSRISMMLLLYAMTGDFLAHHGGKRNLELQPLAESSGSLEVRPDIDSRPRVS